MSSPSPVPVSKFRELSLTSMPPTTRSQAQRQSLQTSSEINDSSSESESASGSSAMSEDDDDDEEEEEDEPSIVTSPSRLTYNLEHLSPQARERVRDTFNHPPRLYLKSGLLFQDNVYAFQMTELVHRSIRIGSPDSRWPTPNCSCMRGNAPPCQHLLWFLDQLAKQTLYDHDPSSPLTMTPGGYPEEIGNPYTDISTFHLDVLADGFHCKAYDPTTGAGEGSETTSDSDDSSESDESDNEDTRGKAVPHRVQEIREMLSAINYTAPEDFRPDLVSSSPSKSKKRPIKRNDLEATIFRMLLANDEFFHYFLSKMRPTDPVNDTFRKLSQRVDLVLRELDAFAAGAPAPTTSTEGPRDVAWAARHITGVVGLIRAAIFKRERPLESRERVSAARTLVHILSGVVERNRDFVPPGTAATAAASIPRQDRNLYLRLVGDRDEGFVLSVLELLPPDAAAPFLFTLEDIQEQLGVGGAPASYVAKFRSLLSRMRRRRRGASVSSATSAAGSKRQSEGPDRGSKRMR